MFQEILNMNILRAFYTSLRACWGSVHPALGCDFFCGGDPLSEAQQPPWEAWGAQLSAERGAARSASARIATSRPPPEMVVSRFALYLPHTMVKTHISLQEKFHGRERTVGQKHSVV